MEYESQGAVQTVVLGHDVERRVAGKVLGVDDTPGLADHRLDDLLRFGPVQRCPAMLDVLKLNGTESLKINVVLQVTLNLHCPILLFFSAK